MVKMESRTRKKIWWRLKIGDAAAVMKKPASPVVNWPTCMAISGSNVWWWSCWTLITDLMTGKQPLALLLPALIESSINITQVWSARRVESFFSVESNAQHAKWLTRVKSCAWLLFNSRQRRKKEDNDNKELSLQNIHREAPEDDESEISWLCFARPCARLDVDSNLSFFPPQSNLQKKVQLWTVTLSTLWSYFLNLWKV